MASSSSDLRDHPRVAPMRGIAATTAPNAYSVTNWPASACDTPIPRLISGSSPAGMFSVSTAMKPVIARANRPPIGSRSAAALGAAGVQVSRMIAAFLIQGVVVRNFAEQLPAAIDLRAMDSLIPDVRGHRLECDGDGTLAASERLLHGIGDGACRCDLTWFARWQGKMLAIHMWHGDFPRERVSRVPARGHEHRSMDRDLPAAHPALSPP